MEKEPFIIEKELNKTVLNDLEQCGFYTSVWTENDFLENHKISDIF